MKNENCATHGTTKIASDKFWKNPLTSHWGCKCF